MKRYRHYQKELAIVLSCFGSVVEQEKYDVLHAYVKERFQTVPVYLALNSRMVLKLLKKKGYECRNTIETLAECDAEGYRRVVVSSVNLFPTSEHKEIYKVINGFCHFSPAHIRGTRAIFSTSKTTTTILREIDSCVRRDDLERLNLYIVHGTPEFEQDGIASISYAKEFLAQMSPKNFFCSLEGAFPFHAMKESLVHQMCACVSENRTAKIQLIPLLLVSGNHFEKDIVQIQQALRSHFDVTIASSLSGGEKFNLIEMKSVQKIICDQIQEEITKLG
jgi:sirohydrochlorin cobaltochelatase